MSLWPGDPPTGRDGQTSQISLWEAASVGDLVRVRALLKANPDAVRETHDDGMTRNRPLHAAAAAGHAEVTAFLLEMAARVNDPDNDGRTPLMYACANGHSEVAELLLNQGAAIDAQDGGSFRTGAEKTALHMAVVGEHVQTVSLLLRRGVDPSVKDKWGKTPAQYASSERIRSLLVAPGVPGSRHARLGFVGRLIGRMKERSLERRLLSMARARTPAAVDPRVEFDKSKEELGRLMRQLLEVAGETQAKAAMQRIEGELSKGKSQLDAALCYRFRQALREECPRLLS